MSKFRKERILRNYQVPLSSESTKVTQFLFPADTLKSKPLQEQPSAILHLTKNLFTKNDDMIVNPP